MALWTPRTMADDLGGANENHTCACGRMVPADMLVNVKNLPGAIRTVAPGGTLKASAPQADYLCDACRARLVHSGAITKSAMVAAFGAPAALVQQMEAPPG